MNAAKPSKLPPRQPCFVIFDGSRHIRDAMYERICEPVEVVEMMTQGQKTLAVSMIGRQQKFKLENFTGLWITLDLEAA